MQQNTPHKLLIGKQILIFIKFCSPFVRLYILHFIFIVSNLCHRMRALLNDVKFNMLEFN